MRLIGKNIILKALDLDDKKLKILQKWLEDEEVVRHAGFAKTMSQSIEHIKSYIKKLQDSNDVRIFGIFFKNGSYIGNIRIDIEWIWGVGTVSLLIGAKSYWGRGYGTEAIRLITDFGFKTLGLYKIEAGILDGNNGSLKAFKKAGFEIEGKKRGNRFNMGKRVATILVGKTGGINKNVS